jgi:hypothetical protein
MSAGPVRKKIAILALMPALSACAREPRRVDRHHVSDAPRTIPTSSEIVHAPTPDGGIHDCCHGGDANGRCYNAVSRDPWPTDIPRCNSAGWKQMSKDLRNLIKRDASRSQDPLPAQLERLDLCFAEDFDRCDVLIRRETGYLVIHAPFGGMWLGVRIAKRAGRWTATQLVGGDIR